MTSAETVTVTAATTATTTMTAMEVTMAMCGGGAYHHRVETSLPLFDISARIRRRLFAMKETRRVGFHTQQRRRQQRGTDEDEYENDVRELYTSLSSSSSTTPIPTGKEEDRDHNLLNDDVDENDVRCSVVEIMPIPDDCRPNYWLSKDDYVRIRAECEQEARQAVQRAILLSFVAESPTPTPSPYPRPPSSTIRKHDSTAPQSNDHMGEMDVYDHGRYTTAALSTSCSKSLADVHDGPDAEIDVSRTSSGSGCGGWTMMQCLVDDDDDDEDDDEDVAAQGAAERHGNKNSSSSSNNNNSEDVAPPPAIVVIPRGLENYFAGFPTTAGTCTAAASPSPSSSSSSPSSAHQKPNSSSSSSCGDNSNNINNEKSPSSLSLSQRRKESIWAVLEEQEFQRGFMYCSPDDIAELYKGMTRQSKYDARQRAKRDELECQ